MSGDASSERKSALMTALSQLESEVDCLKGQGMVAIASSFKAVMRPTGPQANEAKDQSPSPPQSEAISLVERIHEKVCQVNAMIHEFQNRSEA